MRFKKKKKKKKVIGATGDGQTLSNPFTTKGGETTAPRFIKWIRGYSGHKESSTQCNLTMFAVSSNLKAM